MKFHKNDASVATAFGVLIAATLALLSYRLQPAVAFCSDSRNGPQTIQH